jgi:hypothetical protein
MFLMYTVIVVFNSLSVGDHDALQIVLLSTDRSLVEYGAQRLTESTVVQCTTVRLSYRIRIVTTNKRIWFCDDLKTRLLYRSSFCNIYSFQHKHFNTESASFDQKPKIPNV